MSFIKMLNIVNIGIFSGLGIAHMNGSYTPNAGFVTFLFFLVALHNLSDLAPRK